MWRACGPLPGSSSAAATCSSRAGWPTPSAAPTRCATWPGGPACAAVRRRSSRPGTCAPPRASCGRAAAGVPASCWPPPRRSTAAPALRWPRTRRLRPLSQYGRSKQRAERRAATLARRLGVELVVLRFFTVYGPRQRPDMAFARFAQAALAGQTMPLLGDGGQTRDFTYVGDAARATLLALERGRPGATYNVSGGRAVRLAYALGLLAQAIGSQAELIRMPADGREPPATAADLSLARGGAGLRAAHAGRERHRGAGRARRRGVRVLIDTSYATRGPSGTGVYVEQLVRALRERGDVEVVEAAQPRRLERGRAGRRWNPLRSAANAGLDLDWLHRGLPAAARRAGRTWCTTRCPPGAGGSRCPRRSRCTTWRSPRCPSASTRSGGGSRSAPTRARRAGRAR